MNRTVGSSRQRVAGRLSALLLVAAVSLLVAGPALAKGRGGSRGTSVRVTYVEHQGVVQANAPATFTAQCPRSYAHPVGAEFNTLNGGVPGSLALAASYPQGQRGWLAAVENLSAQPQGYYAGIVCLGAKAKFAYPRTTFVVPSNGDGGGFVDCPRAAPHAINGYFGVQATADLGKALLDFTGPGHFKHEVDGAGVKNLSGVPVGLFAGPVCTSLRTAESAFEGVVAPGKDDGFKGSCPSRSPIAVSGAFVAKSEADYGTILMDDSFSIARAKWDVGVRSLTNHPVHYFASTLCVG
jgi:hypothetical protein